MTTLAELEPESQIVTDWDLWELQPSDSLADAVREFASPLLTSAETRNRFYTALNPKWLTQLHDYDLPTATGTTWVEKDETGHEGGAYKLRGACWNLLSQLQANPDIEEAHAATSGNHGLALALACAWINEQLGTNVRPVVHVAEDVSPKKLEALYEVGAHVVKAKTFELARAETETLKEESARPGSKVAVVEAYNDPRTMAGQASCGYEVVADLVGGRILHEGIDPRTDDITLWVPGGGGGFGAGCAVALADMRRQGYIGANVKVKIVQMEGCDALAREYHGQAPLTVDTLDKTCDATALIEAGSLTQRIVGNDEYVTDVVSVPKHYVARAMEILRRQHEYGIEPAGALALAGALWHEAMHPRGDSDPKRAHITVTSGANVTEATETHFKDALSTHLREEFAAQSQEHLDRESYGVDEVLSRGAGRLAVVGHSQMLSGW